MHANGGHIGTGGHGRDGEIFAKIKVGSVGFVCQNKHTGCMSQFDDLPEIATNAVVGGIVDQNSLGIRVVMDGFFYGCDAHAEGNAEFLVGTWVDVRGPRR